MTAIALPSDATIFGRLVGAHHVEDAAVAVLRKWFATYLHEVERGSGFLPGTLSLPRSIRVTSEREAMPEDQTPALIVCSPGTTDIPLTNGARQYQAQFRLELGALVSAKGDLYDGAAPRALRLARIYALALRACLAQQPDDNAILFRRDWTGEDYDTLPSIDDRTICVGVAQFVIEVPDVLTTDAGPIDPFAPPDPPDVVPPVPSPEWPIAVTADATVVKTPITEEQP